jgi:hypothetical protein
MGPTQALRLLERFTRAGGKCEEVDAHSGSGLT